MVPARSSFHREEFVLSKLRQQESRVRKPGSKLASTALGRPTVDQSERLAHLVKDAGKALSRALQDLLAEHSIAYGHWTFLRILWREDGISQAELSQLAGVMAPSTFAAMQAMERLGYVAREQKSDSRKKVYVFLTEAGRALERKLVPLALDVNERATAGLTKKQVDDLRAVLITIIDNLSDQSNRHTIGRSIVNQSP
jgi:DNA-binding MarR family transcriptional regulator